MGFSNEIVTRLGLTTESFDKGLTQAESRLARFDASLKTRGVTLPGTEEGRTARDSAATFEEIIAGEERLKNVREAAAFGRLSTAEKIEFLENQIGTAKQAVNAIEGTTIEKLRLQLSIEERLAMLNTLRVSRGARDAGPAPAILSGLSGAAASAGETAGAIAGNRLLSSLGATLKKFFGFGALFKGLLIGLGFQAAEALGRGVADKLRGGTTEQFSELERLRAAEQKATDDRVMSRKDAAGRVAAIEDQMRKAERDANRPQGAAESLVEAQIRQVNARLLLFSLEKQLEEERVSDAREYASWVDAVNRGVAELQQTKIDADYEALTEEQKIAEQRRRIQLAETDAGLQSDPAKKLAAQNRAATASAELARLLRSQQERTQTAAREAREKEFDASLSKLDVAGQIEQLQKRSLELEISLSLAAEKSADFYELRSKLAENEARIQEKQNQRAQQRLTLERGVREVAETRTALASDREDARKFTLSELASGMGQGFQQLEAREILRLEDRARREQAFGNTKEAERTQAEAERLRVGLGGALRSNEADPFKSQREALTKSEQHLKEIRDSLRPAALGNASDSPQ